MKLTLEVRVPPTINNPDKTLGTEENNKTQTQVREKRVDACVNHMMALDKNMTLSYSLVWG